MKVKREFQTTSKANYTRFLKEQNLTEKDLSYKKFSQVLKTCNWMWIEYALLSGGKVRLPHGFGDIAVNKKMLARFKEWEGKQYVNLKIDWATTKKIGKRVYHTNEHTDGYNFKWTWFPGSSKIHLADVYVFKPCRYASRALAKYIKKPGATYKDNYLEWGLNKYN